MSWKKADELVVASNGEIYIAPVGTTLPTTFAALSSTYTGLGFASEDGVTFTVTPEIEEFPVWQSRQPARRELVAQEIQASFGLTQWNEATVPFAFGGGVISEPSAGVYRYDFIDSSAALDERVLVIDANDGTRKMRIVLSRGNVTESVESQFVRSALALLPITFKALQPIEGGSTGYVLFDDANAFEPGS